MCVGSEVLAVRAMKSSGIECCSVLGLVFDPEDGGNTAGTLIFQ
jgi:hypothetical protein